jgi:hypothetical protein
MEKTFESEIKKKILNDNKNDESQKYASIEEK